MESVMAPTLARLASTPSTLIPRALRSWFVRLHHRRKAKQLDAATRHLPLRLLRDIGLEPHPDDFGARLRRYL